MEVLRGIPFRPDLDALLSRLHIAKGSQDARDFQALLDEVTSVARPKAAYEVSYVEDRREDTVTVGGVVFTSPVLRANLDGVERVFPHVATCGTELDEVPVGDDDLMRSFWLDTIKETALQAARTFLEGHLQQQHAPGQLSKISPGAGPTYLWPIQQQRQLFSLLHGVEKQIGVRLTDSLLMIPTKSVSGIYFPTEVRFEACRLCPREKCPGRHAPYDSKLSQSYHEANRQQFRR